MPPTTHGTISPGQPPRPYLLLPILYYKLCPRPRSGRGHPPVISPLTASTQYQWNHTVSSPLSHSPPATMAPYPRPTQYNHHLLTANANESTRPTTCETINPGPSPTLQVDLLSGKPSTTIGVPARIGQTGTPPLKQPPFVECTCLRFSHTLCCKSVYACM